MFNAKKREIERLQATVDVYGERLGEHHDSMGSCEEARIALQESRNALKARVSELEKKLIAVGHAASKVPEGGS
jgi:chromosome segregation ATPase